MKKPVKIILIIVLLLIIGSCAGLFFFLKTFEVNQFKPQIILAAQGALNRQVSLGDIALNMSFKNGIQLALRDFAVSEDHEFGEGNFFTSKSADFVVSVKDLILERQIKVLGVEVQSPEITIIRLKDGRINVQSFGKPGEGEPPSQGSSPQEQSAKSSPALAPQIPALLVSRININNGCLRYIDKSSDPALSFAFRDISLRIDDFSLRDAFAFELKGAFLASEQNIIVQGRAQVHADTQAFEIKDLKASSDLSKLSMKMLSDSVSTLKNASLPTELKGQLQWSVDQLTAGANGLAGLKANGVLTNGSLRLKELAIPITPISADLRANESEITLNSMSLGLGAGNIQISGALLDYLKRQDYQASIKAEGIHLGDLLDQSKSSVKLQGLLFGGMELKGSGFDPDTMLTNLSGSGSFEIKEGRLENINVLKAVLDKLSLFPNLSEKLENNLPERFKATLLQKDTIIASCKGGLGIADGALLVRPFNMEADGFLPGQREAGVFEGQFQL